MIIYNSVAKAALFLFRGLIFIYELGYNKAMYTIYWTETDGYYAKHELATWWETIGYIVSRRVGLNSIACSDNDLVSVYEFEHKSQKYIKKIYRRNVFIYDEYDRIIPYSEIRDACEEYREPVKKRELIAWGRPRIFRFRFDPVPYIGVRHGASHNRPHRYKNTWAGAMFDDDDPRLREHFEIISDWDGKYRKNDKNWKEYRKTQYKGA